MRVKIVKSFFYAADGIHTVEVKPGEIHDIDPARFPGLMEIGVVVPFEGDLPAGVVTLAPEDPNPIPPRSANADGTSRAQHQQTAAVRVANVPVLTEAEQKAAVAAKAKADAKAEADAKAKADADAKASQRRG